jgi:CHAD domain-containing protein
MLARSLLADSSCLARGHRVPRALYLWQTYPGIIDGRPVTSKTVADDLPAELRTILVADIQAARHHLIAHRVPSDAAIHAARQSIKRARATLRLLRTSIGDQAYRCANIALRDAASPLRGVRDAKALLDTLKNLSKRRSQPNTSTTLLRRAYDRQRGVARHALAHAAAEVNASESNLTAMLQHVRLLTVKGDGLKGALIGAKRTYAKGRAALVPARRNPSDSHLHAWRKQAKYLFYQLRLLCGLRRCDISTCITQARKLGDLLGKDHDLAVLQQRTGQKGDEVVTKPACVALAASIVSRRVTLQKKAMALGARLYKRTPKRFMLQFENGCKD